MRFSCWSGLQLKAVVVFLDKTLHPPCLLMVIRGLGGADCMAASFLSVCPRRSPGSCRASEGGQAVERRVDGRT
ncbi:hypothetical protein AMECASPLE_016093, partial [Ameca splendens]